MNELLELSDQRYDPVVCHIQGIDRVVRFLISFMPTHFELQILILIISLHVFDFHLLILIFALSPVTAQSSVLVGVL